MMGTKERNFAPLDRVSLEELVPECHFYRRLDAALDLSFVRDLVKDRYAVLGRPSVDPVVFFRLQLVMFFEDIRSERQLMEVGADRLSIRWFLGYDLHEPLPDHSSLTRIRERYGLEIFRRFFERIVELCVETGLVWGKELYFDATKVEANASLDSMGSRSLMEHSLEEHLAGIFPEEEKPQEVAKHAAERCCGTRRSGRTSALRGKRAPAPMDLTSRTPAAGGASVGLHANGRSPGKRHRSGRLADAMQEERREQARIPDALRSGWGQGEGDPGCARDPRRGHREPTYARAALQDPFSLALAAALGHR
jgi:transposase